MNINSSIVQAIPSQKFLPRHLQLGQIETLKQAPPQINLIAKKLSISETVITERPGNLAVVVGYKQQQALLETAKKAFSQDESEPSTDLITGDIAMYAAKKQQRQVLIFTAIESINERVSERPRIQTQA